MTEQASTAIDQAGVQFPPPLVYIGFLMIGLGAERWIGLGGFGLGSMLRIVVGLIAAVSGTAIIASASRLFGRAGTPAPPWQSVKTIVGDGLYAATRNPMYLGMAFMQAGLAILFDNRLALLLVAASLLCVRLLVIAREEAYLERKFGEAYLGYKRSVARWF